MNSLCILTVLYVSFNRIDLKRRVPRSKFFYLTPSIWEKVCDACIDFTEYLSSNCINETDDKRVRNDYHTEADLKKFALTNL